MRKSERSSGAAQSEIRAMTLECQKAGGINMAQGVCDLDVPDCVIEGAVEALRDGHNIYTPCEGLVSLRQAVAARQKIRGMDVDPEQEVVVSIGATGAFYAACLALLNPGDEVILFEPYYGYHAATLAALGCVPRFVRLQAPEWAFSRAELEQVCNSRTRAVILNTPANPCGKVFSRAEIELIGSFAVQHDLTVFTDEIYEHFVYDGLRHLSPAAIPGLQERTVTISGLSKVFSITGWRLGYAICPAEAARSIAYFNDLVYVCAPAPLQIGAARGLLELGPEYYQQISKEHQAKRDQFCEVLGRVGLDPFIPQGAYYVMADTSRVPGDDDKQRALFILAKTGVACVPGRAFYHDEGGQKLARFCFAKKQPVLDEACERLQKLKKIL